MKNLNKANTAQRKELANTPTTKTNEDLKKNTFS
jgi:hypothetical protein